jgi:hypothetical protein
MLCPPPTSRYSIYLIWFITLQGSCNISNTIRNYLDERSQKRAWLTSVTLTRRRQKNQTRPGELNCVFHL